MEKAAKNEEKVQVLERADGSMRANGIEVRGPQPCCENGNMTEAHECMKQPDTLSAEDAAKLAEPVHEVEMPIPKDVYVPLSKVPSRDVRPVAEDLNRMIKDVNIMARLCYMQHGLNGAAYAIAHIQVCPEDHMRFFVMRTGEVVINPRIIRHAGTTKLVDEGCMSFPWHRMKKIPRYTKLTVEYYALAFNIIDPETHQIKTDLPEASELFVRHEQEVRGIHAQIFQHEMDHFDAKPIFGGEDIDVFASARKLGLKMDTDKIDGIKTDGVGRNEPCPCESGKKFKKCHGV